MTRFFHPLFTASALALILSACATAPAVSPVPATAGTETAEATSAASTLPGRYYLRGVMETASGLELFEDGTFRWYLIVGALDVLGSGSWALKEDRVHLIYKDVKTNAEFPELSETFLIRSGNNLKPDDGSSGIYVRAKPPSP